MTQISIGLMLRSRASSAGKRVRHGAASRSMGPPPSFETGASRPPQDEGRSSARVSSMKPIAVLLAAATANVLSSAGAFAAEWPGKPVRVVVPFAAGGAADTIGRLHADALTAAFGKQFYVENRVGGGGLVGTEAVARAEPDGLTLMVSGIPTHVLGPAMNKNVGFDPMRDFTHIAYFGGT